MGGEKITTVLSAHDRLREYGAWHPSKLFPLDRAAIEENTLE